MDIKDELVFTICDVQVKQMVSKMFENDFEFNGHKDRMPVESYDMSFRLFKPTKKVVNLEFLVRTPIGSCFQPVGFFDDTLKIHILHEFLESYRNLKSNDLIVQEAFALSTRINAVIAAFSIRTMEYVLEIFSEVEENKNQKMFSIFDFDKRFNSNGYSCELIICEDGYPQFYLDDQYGISDPIGAYILNTDGSMNIQPTIEFKSLYDSLKELRLLTVFNII